MGMGLELGDFRAEKGKITAVAGATAGETGVTFGGDGEIVSLVDKPCPKIPPIEQGTFLRGIRFLRFGK
jgi:hypothetical protein